MGIENFESIKAMMEMLKKEGSPDIAQEMQDAIRGTNIGTELFGNVGLVLKKVARSQVSEMTKARAVKMRKEISVLIKFKFED